MLFIAFALYLNNENVVVGLQRSSKLGMRGHERIVVPANHVRGTRVCLGDSLRAFELLFDLDFRLFLSLRLLNNSLLRLLNLKRVSVDFFVVFPEFSAGKAACFLIIADDKACGGGFDAQGLDDIIEGFAFVDDLPYQSHAFLLINGGNTFTGMRE